MAKKKGARKAASRGARKKAVARRGARKAAPRQAGPPFINLEPLKKIITGHIQKLEKAAPSPDVDKALELLRGTKASLSSACATASPKLNLPMVIEL